VVGSQVTGVCLFVVVVVVMLVRCSCGCDCGYQQLFELQFSKLICFLWILKHVSVSLRKVVGASPGLIVSFLFGHLFKTLHRFLVKEPNVSIKVQNPHHYCYWNRLKYQIK